MMATGSATTVGGHMDHHHRLIQAAVRLALVAIVYTATVASAGDAAQDPVGQKNTAPAEETRGVIQGPATSAPREIFEMLEQRKRLLDKREVALHGAETRLLELKAELEQIVSRHEQLVEAEKKRNQPAKPKAAIESDKSKDPKNAGGARNVNQVQLAKIYEAMPPEEAAARLERMPERKALEVLRLLKGKSAGSILAEVKPDRAARLTEQLLTTP